MKTVGVSWQTLHLKEQHQSACLYDSSPWPIVQVTVYDMIIWTLRPYAIAAETQLSLFIATLVVHISTNLDVHTTRFNPLWLPNLHLKFISDNSKIRLPNYLGPVSFIPYYPITSLLSLPSDFCRSASNWYTNHKQIERSDKNDSTIARLYCHNWHHCGSFCKETGPSLTSTSLQCNKA